MQDEACRDAAARYRDMVWRVACNACSHRQDAEDITQDVFLKLYATRRTFADDDHLKRWLLRVTLNACKSRWRSPWHARRADPETLPDAVRQDAALMQPFDFENKEDQRRLILNDSINLGFSVPGASVHYSTGSNTGDLREYGEALLPFDSWEDAGVYLGVMLPTPGIVADMHPLTNAIEPNDLDSYYTARVRLAGDAASDTVEATEVAIEWLNAEGMLTMKAYQLYGEGETGRLSVQNLFKNSEIDAQTAAWHAEEYRMANGNTATIAVSEADAGDDRAWAFFAEGNCACTLEWNANDFAATQSPRAMLEAVLDSFP